MHAEERGRCRWREIAQFVAGSFFKKSNEIDRCLVRKLENDVR